LDHNESVNEILNHHVEALLHGDVAEILRDYNESSLIYTPEGPVHGLVNLEVLFTSFLTGLPAGALDEFEILRCDIYENTAYILWHAGAAIPLGTDTYLIRNNKIEMQSFAAYMP